MRGLTILDRFRVEYQGELGGSCCGAFMIPSKIDKQILRVLASADAGWDHVSVSRRDRCPWWREMAQIKHLFFEDDECAIQLHVPVEDHKNVHQNCLHLWRPHYLEIPRPPACFV